MPHWIHELVETIGWCAIIIAAGVGLAWLLSAYDRYGWDRRVRRMDVEDLS